MKPHAWWKETACYQPDGPGGKSLVRYDNDTAGSSQCEYCYRKSGGYPISMYISNFPYV